MKEPIYHYLSTRHGQAQCDLSVANDHDENLTIFNTGIRRKPRNKTSTISPLYFPAAEGFLPTIDGQKKAILRVS